MAVLVYEKLGGPRKQEAMISLKEPDIGRKVLSTVPLFKRTA